jgi:Na+-translocating ferredoxin:NAD+ oxidoreductase subunit G
MKGEKIPSYRQRLGYHSGLLGGIGLLASMALVITDVETRDYIAEAKAAEQRVFLNQVMPPELYDNDPLKETVSLADSETKKEVMFYIARKNNQVTATAYKVFGYGYSGEIALIVGVDREGKILGVRVLSHKETPGLGDKIELSRGHWIHSFEGKSQQSPNSAGWHVKKDGGIFDQFTGATITPRAVVKAVKHGLDFFNAHRTEIVDKSPPVEPPPPSAKAIEYGNSHT